MTESRRIAPIWILLTMFVAIPVLAMASCLGYKAFEARRPKDMPLSSIWIDAPAVPFGFYHGWWEGCWLESDQQANHCRLYLSAGNRVVYEGRFMPCDAKSAIPTSEIKLKPPSQSTDMWISPNPRFVALLEDGRILVPLKDVSECPKIRQTLERKKTASQGNN